MRKLKDHKNLKEKLRSADKTIQKASRKVRAFVEEHKIIAPS